MPPTPYLRPGHPLPILVDLTQILARHQQLYSKITEPRTRDHTHLRPHAVWHPIWHCAIAQPPEREREHMKDAVKVANGSADELASQVDRRALVVNKAMQ